MTDNNVVHLPPPPPGHNLPPAYDPEAYGELEGRVAQFADAGGDWIQQIGDEITSDEQSSQLHDMIAGAKKLRKEAEEKRKAATKPYRDAVDSVNTAFGRLTHRLEKIVKTLEPLQTKWLRKKQEELDEERRREREQAEEEQRRARELEAQAQARGDLQGQADAEQAQQEAEKAAKKLEKAAPARARVESASGGAKAGSLRTYRTARITNLRLAFMHYQATPEGEAALTECLQKLAAADVRAAKGADVRIPGVEAVEEQRA